MFARSTLLYQLLWIVPSAIVFFLIARHRRARVLRRFFGDAGNQAAGSVSPQARLVRAILMVAALVGIGVALAGPRWGTQPKPQKVVGCDVVILLDVSKSMLARDSKPDRLTLAKSLVDELLSQLPGCRFGLVAFAGTAYTAVPLTSSLDSVRMILDDLDPMTQPYGGSRLDVGLEAILESNQDGTGFAPVVIFSDGEEHSESGAELAAKIKGAGLTVYSVGLGDPSIKSRIQLPDNSFVTYRDKPVRTQLNPKPLEVLASATDGAYLHADTEPLASEKVAAAIRERMDSGMRADSGVVPIERFQWLLAGSVILLALRSLIGESRMATVALLIVCAGIPANGSNDADPTPVAAAREAVEQATDPHIRRRESFRLAMLLYDADQAAEAKAIYKDIVLDARTPSGLRSRALQNLGVIHHGSGDASFKDDPKSSIESFAKAIRFYRAALALRYDADLARNLEWGVKRLALAEERLKTLQERRRRRNKAIRELILARDHRKRSNDQPTAEEENELALKMTVEGGKTAKPLEVEGLDAAVDAAIKFQKSFRNTSALDERRRLGGEALVRIVEALRLLGVKDPKEQERPPKEGDEPPPKGDWKDTPKDLPENLRILREIAEKEKNDYREISEEVKKRKRGGRGEEKDW